MRRVRGLIAAGFFIASLPLGGPLRAALPSDGGQPTRRQRDLVEEALAPNLVLPQTAMWQFAALKPYVDGARLICGWVNYQSLMRRYVGIRRFYAILDEDRVTLAQIEDDQSDPSGRLHGKLDMLCGKAPTPG
jgi:hypothetical protein